MFSKRWLSVFLALCIPLLLGLSTLFYHVTFSYSPVTFSYSPDVVPSQVNGVLGGNATLIIGRRPQRIELDESLRLDKIHIVIKSSAKFHYSRLELLMLTWLQTAPPGNVSSLKVCCHACCIHFSIVRLLVWDSVTSLLRLGDYRALMGVQARSFSLGLWYVLTCTTDYFSGQLQFTFVKPTLCKR